MSNLNQRLLGFVNQHPQLARPLKQFLRRYLGRFFPASGMDVERAEWRFYLDYLREGMIVFDVGANLGETSHFFSRFVGSEGQVHAFEASSATFERLRATCALKEHANIVLNHLAVADAKKMIQLYVYPPEYWGLNSMANRPLEDYGLSVSPAQIEEVPATTIDAYCQEHGITHIDLLKIDVEGAEFQVLQGAQHMLAQKRIRCGLFEFGQTTFDMGNDPQAIQAYLHQHGYGVSNLIPGNPLFPRDRHNLGQFSMHIIRPRR